MDIEIIGDKAFWNQEEENAYWPRACPICAGILHALNL